MRKTIETPLKPGYGRDDGDVDRGGGINLVPGVWEAPSNPTPDELSAARLWLRVYEAETATVSAKDLEKWIATLVGNLQVSAGNGEDDLSFRVKLLSIAVDERAAKHFSKDALKLAWQRFKFVPTANELMAFFDDLESLERTQAQRLMAVLDAGNKPAVPEAAPVDVDESMRRHREKQDRDRRELAALLAERDAAAGKFAPDAAVLERGPGETDRAFGLRLAEQCRQQITLGHLALKRDSRMRAMAQKSAAKAAYEATGIEVEPPAAAETASATAQNTSSCDGGGA